MIKGSTIRMRRRTLIVAFVTIFVFFTILSIRLFYLQIISGPYLFKMANLQQLASTKLSPRRGVIYDRNMVPLAQSATVWNVVLEPNYIKTDATKELISQGLHEILGTSKEKLLELSEKKSCYTIIEKKIDSDTKNKIVEFKSKNNITNGIRLIEDYKRYYPKETLASTVLGFTGSDSQGLAGLETQYDSVLGGEEGKLVSAKNAIGTDMPYDYEHMIPPKDGNNLVLTLDSTIQSIVEERLKKAIEENDVRNRGAMIVMNPKNGEILALAVEKGFNPNKPFEISDQKDLEILKNTPEEEKQKKESEILFEKCRNKAISDNYYPGSVFKIIMASIGLELGIANEETNFNCTGGIKIGGDTIRCHKRSGHGPLNLVGALCKSCNPYFISLGQKIGTERFFDFYKSFGFHEKTGIDLPGEGSDIFFSKNGDMHLIDLAVASIGQNFGITPIQMATAACAIANGGKLVTPHIVKEIRDNDGNVIQSFDPKPRRQVISEETARRVTAMMEQNATSGGVKNAYIPGFRVAGKSGTSEKKDLLVPGEKDYIASFLEFAPANDPEVLLLCYADTPKGRSYYGAPVCIPPSTASMNEILLYKGVQPQYNEEEMKKYGIKVPNLIDKKVEEAKKISIDLGLKPLIVGKGETVIRQTPYRGERISLGGNVIIYTDDSSEEKVKVPNFVGLKKSDAVKLAESLGLNIFASGSNSDDDTVSTQSLAESELVDKGTTINIVVGSGESED